MHYAGLCMFSENLCVLQGGHAFVRELSFHHYFVVHVLVMIQHDRCCLMCVEERVEQLNMHHKIPVVELVLQMTKLFLSFY